MTITQQEQPRGHVDDTGYESIKLEKNTKGYNWSIRVVLKDGETMDQAFFRLVEINRKIYGTYGMQ